jgi:hypothetical protein
MLQNCPFHKITHQYVNFTVHPNLQFNLHIQVNNHNSKSQKQETIVVYSNWKLNIKLLVRQSKPTNKFPIEKSSNFTMCICLFERLIISNSNFKITMETHNSNTFEKSAELKLLFQICTSDV